MCQRAPIAARTVAREETLHAKSSSPPCRNLPAAFRNLAADSMRARDPGHLNPQHRAEEVIRERIGLHDVAPRCIAADDVIATPRETIPAARDTCPAPSWLALPKNSEVASRKSNS
jgi:hypothetical protein